MAQYVEDYGQQFYCS